MTLHVLKTYQFMPVGISVFSFLLYCTSFSCFLFLVLPFDISFIFWKPYQHVCNNSMHTLLGPTVLAPHCGACLWGSGWHYWGFSPESLGTDAGCSSPRAEPRLSPGWTAVHSVGPDLGLTVCPGLGLAPRM